MAKGDPQHAIAEPKVPPYEVIFLRFRSTIHCSHCNLRTYLLVVVNGRLYTDDEPYWECLLEGEKTYDIGYRTFQFFADRTCWPNRMTLSDFSDREYVVWKSLIIPRGGGSSRYWWYRASPKLTVTLWRWWFCFSVEHPIEMWKQGSRRQPQQLWERCGD